VVVGYRFQGTTPGFEVSEEGDGASEVATAIWPKWLYKVADIRDRTRPKSTEKVD
jgi:hypothetical protein